MSAWIRRAADSDIWWSFKSSPMTVVASIATFLIIAIAFLSPVLAPHTPFDPATLSLSDGLKPPVLISPDGDWAFPLGTDDQGRDILSSIMYGTRLSLIVGLTSVVVAMVIYAIVFYAAPNVEVRHFRWITPGAVVGVLLWILASGLFFVYVSNFSSYSAT